jgi:glycosyltransferase involved in cell wall biosynthesis
MNDSAIELSIVVPAFNEEQHITPFLETTVPIVESLVKNYEIVFVNDGSRDRSLDVMLSAREAYPRVRVVNLARNFGKDVALSAGLSYASGAAVIPIDCDLQHPPSLIPDMYQKWREGSDMVVAIRASRSEESFIRRSVSQLFYRILLSMTSVDIPINAGDYRLLDRKIVDVINRMEERSRFLKGIYAWPGFKKSEVYFKAEPRKGGSSTWTVWKLWNYALDGIFSFSSSPLRIWTYIGFLAAATSLFYFLWTVIKTLIFGIKLPGYASLLSLLLLFNSLILISNGIQGEYLARMFDEVKRRPLFVVNGTWGFSPEEPVVSAEDKHRS